MHACNPAAQELLLMGLSHVLAQGGARSSPMQGAWAVLLNTLNAADASLHVLYFAQLAKMLVCGSAC